MQMVAVTSSNINAVGYDEESRELRIEFKDGTYAYQDVDPSTAAELMEATSVGRYFHQNVKLYYQGVRQ